MMSRLVDVLLKRTPRERRLLAILIVLGVPLAVVFGVLFPLQEELQSARLDRAEARALNEWMAERVVEASELGLATKARRPEPIGSSGLEQSLINAGLRAAVSDLGMRDGGTIELRFDSVTFTALADWLSAERGGWGYRIAAFRFEAAERSGKVAATLSLAPEG